MKPQAKKNLIHQQILGGLIDTKPVSWDRKTVSKDEAGKEVIESSKVTHEALRFPLAQNVSEHSVDRAAAKWAK
jgi:hypothetical protein